MEGETLYYSLYMFTRIWLEKSQKDVRSGRCHEARDFVRFVRNSRIVDILKLHSGGPLKIDGSHLEWQVAELEKEIRYGSKGGVVLSVKDLAELHRKLEFIAAHVAKLVPSPAPTKKPRRRLASSTRLDLGVGL